jgi:hypothetical protein
MFPSLIFYHVTVLVFGPAVQATQHCFGLRSEGFLGHHQKCFFLDFGCCCARAAVAAELIARSLVLFCRL